MNTVLSDKTLNTFFKKKTKHLWNKIRIPPTTTFVKNCHGGTRQHNKAKARKGTEIKKRATSCHYWQDVSIENPKEYTDNIKNLFNWVQNQYIKSILFLDTNSKHFQNKNLKICLPYNKSHMPETHMRGLNRENDKTLRDIKDVSTCLWFGKLNIVKISISPQVGS